ncbi:MAG: DNA-3-methyladenine glycosylase 2 family protein [Rhodobacteraceae bacterium]|nr:DNA-3-methyladenine glycosylase 2 family protein [Paracoccaceae bacterium]
MARETLNTDADLSRSVKNLIMIEPRFAQIVDEAARLRLRRTDQGFSALAELIISQQLSVAASDTIVRRLQDADLFTRDSIAGAGSAQLRACGVSGQKITYLKALAESRIDLESLRDETDAMVIETLTSLRGIGVWTAEIYLMFALGRPDVFPAGDLALREAGRMLLDLSDRPKESDMRRIAAGWQPFRTAAAHLLWIHYRAMKGRDGVRS